MWRSIPVSYYDMVSIEYWLEEMAQKGLFLSSVGILGATFHQDEPRAVRYRAEPLDTASSIPTQEQLDYYAACGWHYVCTVRELYRIFRADDPAVEELHTDPVVLSAAMSDLERRSRGLYFSSIVLLFLYPALILVPMAFQSMLSLVEGRFQTGLLLALCLLLVYGWNIIQVHSMRALRRQLRAGIVREGRAAGFRRARAVKRSILTTSLVLWLICLAGTFAPYFPTERPYTGPAPTYPLAELEGRNDQPEHSVARERDLLSDRYSVDLRYDDHYLHIYCYELNLPFLAEPLLDDILDRRAVAPAEEVDLPGFDQALTAADGGMQQLFLQKDGTVFLLYYTGAQDLTQRPDLLAGLASYRTSV